MENMEIEILQKRKQMIYELMCDKAYKPMKQKELAILLQIAKEDRADLVQVLDELLLEGKIQISKRGKYAKSIEELLVGTYTAHAKGFGFVSVEDMEADIYIPEADTHGAMHKDTVQLILKHGAEKKGKRREGKIIKIIAHDIKEIVGTFQKNKNFGFVIPDNQRLTRDFFIPLERSKGAVTGQKVVAVITDYGSASRKPEAKVTEILGHINDPGVDIMSIVKEYELPEAFGPEIMHAAQQCPDAVREEELQHRLDLRDVRMITIDGEDAKDLDDAVHVVREDGNYILGVHIADVTHYVEEKSILNKEAYKRGTSIYLADRVIPMLPHRLSNGICSLNAGTDRLALSCIMTISPKGKVLDHEIAETVIHVDQRMSYNGVRDILSGEHPEIEEEYAAFVPMLKDMEHLAEVLREVRKNRGSIDFDFPETKVILDNQGHPVEIKAYERNTATRIIEEFMLLANETVAEDYYWQEIPFVYRTHENPDPDRIQKLGLFINNFGYAIKIGHDEIHPKELQKLLGRIEGSQEEALISRLTLRSMKQAKYTTACSGHFGLAAKYYCHFTSPIRRYPDLQIHRIIKENLHKRMSAKRFEHYEKILPETAKHASEMERRAEEAERETIKLKKVEYMQSRIGECFDGVISSLTAWGMYIELDNTVEGMIHISNLHDDYYVYFEEKQEIVGERTQKAYKLGQKLRIRVTDADKATRTIDFELA